MIFETKIFFYKTKVINLVLKCFQNNRNFIKIISNLIFSISMFYEKTDLSKFEIQFYRLACFMRKLFRGYRAYFGHDFHGIRTAWCFKC